MRQCSIEEDAAVHMPLQFRPGAPVFDYFCAYFVDWCTELSVQFFNPSHKIPLTPFQTAIFKKGIPLQVNICIA